ncbi:MAG: hypothetical protein PHE27_04645 [Alphaproteobacteria bacterium]|nr:hypothetical protein [Alphaproteobacteria bacterium]
MTITQDELQDLLKATVAIDDRKGLPCEGLFTAFNDPVLSETQIEERNKAAIERHSWYGEPFRSLGETIGCSAPQNAFAHYSGFCLSDPTLSPYACEIGDKVFGGWLDTIPGAYSLYHAVLFTTSPCVSPDLYWSRFSNGVLTGKKATPAVNDLVLLHEGGHVIFNGGSPYENEMLADGFAIRTFLNSGGDKRIVRDYIAARRMGAFSAWASPEYSTAKGCEAVMGKMKKMTIPTEFGATIPVYQLQYLACSELEGVSPGERRFDKLTQELHLQTEEESTRRLRGIRERFNAATMPVVIDSLERALEKTDYLSYDVRAEGEATVAAFRNWSKASWADTGKELLEKPLNRLSSRLRRPAPSCNLR